MQHIAGVCAKMIDDAFTVLPYRRVSDGQRDGLAALAVVAELLSY